MFDECGADEIDEIFACDRVIRAAQAKQAEVVARMYDKRIELSKSHPIFSLDVGAVAKSVIAEVAMARQISASAAGNQFGFALGLRSMPLLTKLFARGQISEHAARTVVAEIGGLSPDDASEIDRLLAPDLAAMTARKAGVATRKLVLGIDPHAAKHAAQTAKCDRHISIHVLPHAMASISMRIPAIQAQAVFKALDNVAQGMKYEGDPRTASQIMCDMAVERLTGQKLADGLAVEIGLLMTPESFFAGDDSAALLAGYGPIPASIGRKLATGSKAWVRRLLMDPITGDLLDRDPRRRRIDGPLAGFVRDRDQQCRRPYCDCQIRDLDHIDRYDGSNTTVDNAQGLCERSHTTKHLPGWKVESTRSGTIWTTPTGRTYSAMRPDLRGYQPKQSFPVVPDHESALERKTREFLLGAGRRRRQ